MGQACNGEVLERGAVVQQRKKLNLRGAQIHFRRLQIGFVGNPLKLQTVEIDLRDRAGFIALAVYIKKMVVIREIFLGQIENGLFLKRLNEGRPQIKDEGSLQVRLSRTADFGPTLATLHAQPPLLLTS